MRVVRFTALALTAAFAAAEAGAEASREVLPWIEDDYGKALGQARARNTPIFVEAWAPW